VYVYIYTYIHTYIHILCICICSYRHLDAREIGAVNAQDVRKLDLVYGCVCVRVCVLYIYICSYRHLDAREIGAVNAQDVRKLDLVYGCLLLLFPEFVSCLVDDSFVTLVDRHVSLLYWYKSALLVQKCFTGTKVLLLFWTTALSRSSTGMSACFTATKILVSSSSRIFFGFLRMTAWHGDTSVACGERIVARSLAAI